MLFYKFSAIFLTLYLLRLCSGDISVKEAQELMEQIRAKYKGAAKYITEYIWDDTVDKNDLDGDGKMNEEEMKKVYEKMKEYDETFLGDPVQTFEKDWKAIDVQPKDGFISKKEMIRAIVFGAGGVLEDLIRIGFNEDVDINPKDGMLNEAEILKFAPKLTAYADGIKSDQFIGVISNLVPNSLGQVYKDMFQDVISKKLDRNKDGKVIETEGKPLLSELKMAQQQAIREEMRKINAEQTIAKKSITPQSIFKEMDLNTDGILSKDEFAAYVLDQEGLDQASRSIKTALNGQAADKALLEQLFESTLIAKLEPPRNGDGVVNKNEALKSALFREIKTALTNQITAETRAISAGMNEAKKKIVTGNIFKEMDADADGILSADEFAEYMKTHMGQPGLQKGLRAVVDAFKKSFDKNRNNKVDAAESELFFKMAGGDV